MKKRPLYIEPLLGASIFICAAAFVIKPAEAAQSAREGITLCLDVIVPSLFPFFVLSTLIVELGLARYLGKTLDRVMRPLFGVSGACSAALALGFVGGYPVGARTTLALYEKGACSKTEAERLLSFCNNSGPAFILGAVGAGIFTSSKAGWLLYLSHTAASLTVGLIFRFYKRGEPPRDGGGAARAAEPVRMSRAFTGAVRSSFDAIMGVCAFVIFFAVAIRMLYVFGILGALGAALGVLLKPLGVTPGLAERLLAGLIEAASGLWALQNQSAALTQKLALAAFMLGWAGLSVHCQVLSFIGDSGLKMWPYITGKLLHGVFSALYAILLMRVLDFRLPVSGYLLEEMDGLSRLDFMGALSGTLRVASVICAVIVFWAAAALLKRNWKRV